MTTASRRDLSHRSARRPTLKDVAALAGVSMKTVSRVINGEPGVAPAKVESVEQAVRQLDYRPNLTASSLRRLDGRTAAVAALLEDLANPFSAELHRALEDVAHDHDVLLFAGSLDESPEREKQLVRAFTSRRADALIIAPASSDQSYLAYEVPEGTPVVFVDRAPVGFDADAVVADNVEGARRAVTHLHRPRSPADRVPGRQPGHPDGARPVRGLPAGTARTRRAARPGPGGARARRREPRRGRRSPG